MKKNCASCKHDDAEYPCYPYKIPCNECVRTYNDAPTKWEAADHYKPDTNADRIRGMSEAEFAEFWISRMTYCECCAKKGWCSADGVDYAACIDGVKEWLKQPAEENDGNKKL